MKISPIFFLPNIFTAASIYLGILAIVYASKGSIVIACWLIVVAMIFDGLDGRVARMTNSTSKFGKEFDSLADIVSFGVAPAFILYFSYAYEYGKYGVVVVALFVIFGAIRLARFNISTDTQEPNVFIGVPIPTAALFVVSWILLSQEYEFSRAFITTILFVSFLISLLMVSNIRYPSFKKLDIKEQYKRKVFVFVILILGLLYLYPKEGVAFLVTTYVLYGPLRAIYFIKEKRAS